MLVRIYDAYWNFVPRRLGYSEVHETFMALKHIAQKDTWGYSEPKKAIL